MVVTIISNDRFIIGFTTLYQTFWTAHALPFGLQLRTSRTAAAFLTEIEAFFISQTVAKQKTLTIADVLFK